MANHTPDFLAELDAIDANAASLFALPAEQLVHQAAPNKWSALQCIEHLTLFNDAYILAIDEAVRIAHLSVSRPTAPFRYSLLERLLIWGTNPPSRLKVPIPSPSVAPQPTRDAEEVRSAYHANHQSLARCIRDTMAIDMRATRISSPFIKRVSGNVGIVLGILLAHERRHLYQAWVAATGHPPIVTSARD